MRWVLAALLLPSIALADKPAHKNVCSGDRFRCFAHVQLDIRGKIRLDAAPAGLGPPDLAAAYRIDTTQSPGATIAIIDAFGYATLEADLAVYRSTYGLPPCTVASGCLTIVNQSGQTSPLPVDPPATNDWTTETALDVDMASAGCPNCKILVVQATDDRSDGLFVANNTAAAMATVVSNSWGGSESGGGEEYFDHPGVAIFASSGDNGYRMNRGSLPASSAHVVAVGGTSLLKNSSTLRGWTETAWDGGGSSCSKVIAKPAWQTDNTCGMRAYADVSAVGDPATGVAVYNHGGWTVVGGTSASSPLVAAIYALTRHADATGQLAYQHPGSFFDVTEGTNGTCGNILCMAGIGWDGPTGIGTPNASALAGATAPAFSITPADGAAVPHAFTITATCTPTDASTILAVEVKIDNLPLAPLTTPPYTVSLPATQFSLGHHVVTATCTTSALVTATATSSITLGEPCDTGADCPLETDLCFSGMCIAGQNADNGLGATCGGNAECASGACGSSGNDQHCTVPCDADMSCPAGFTCLSAGAENVCWPVADTVGPCSAGGSPPMWLGLGLALAAITRRRRRA